MKRLIRKADSEYDSTIDEINLKVGDTKLGYAMKDVIKEIDIYNFIEFVEDKGYSQPDQLYHDYNKNFAYVIGIEAFKKLNLVEELFVILQNFYEVRGEFDQETKDYLNSKIDNLDRFANVDDLNEAMNELIQEADDLQDELDDQED